MNIITLQSDYPIVSLSSIGQPVKIVEVLVPDIRVVEGMEGVMVLEDEFIEASMVTEEEFQGTVFEEEEPVAVMEEIQDIGGIFATEEPMEGVFDPEDC